MEDLKAEDFVPMLVRRAFWGVLLGGGSPCQGNSALNRRRRGLDDMRSQQPLELQRLVYEFEQLPACQGMEIVAFLENVASMPNQVQQAYEAWLADHQSCWMLAPADGSRVAGSSGSGPGEVWSARLTHPRTLGNGAPRTPVLPSCGMLARNFYHRRFIGMTTSCPC